MKNLIVALFLLFSGTVFADESCEIKLGFNDYFIKSSKDGAIAESNGKALKLVYWEDNELKTVSDAKITILKVIPFHEEQRHGQNGTGNHWTNTINDYAVRIKVTTKSTEIYPAAMGNRAVKEMTVSTMCTSNVRSH